MFIIVFLLLLWVMFVVTFGGNEEDIGYGYRVSDLIIRFWWLFLKYVLTTDCYDWLINHLLFTSTLKNDKPSVNLVVDTDQSKRNF